MSSSQLISESSDQSSPSLPVSGLPLSTPQPPSSSLLPSTSSPPFQTPVLPFSPVKQSQLPEMLVDTLVSECQQPEILTETELQLSSGITPDLENTLIEEEVKDTDLERESLETNLSVNSTINESLIDSKHNVEPKGKLEEEKPLEFSSPGEPEPVEEPVKEPIQENTLEPELPEEKLQVPSSGLQPIFEPMEICEYESNTITQLPQSQSTQSQPSYHLKWVKLKGNKYPIVTQNENGPCPLIAIINVLLVKGRLRLPSMMEVITANQLIEYLGDCILENIPKGLKEEDQLNYEQNMHDAIAILPKLQTGLDVNVRFTGVSDFEYTPELIFFDLLHIPLYHGWLVDPNDIETVTSIGNLSYNQLVDKIITHKTSTRPELAFEALVVEHFLERTASQLTYHGLSQLNSTLKDGELSVLFRNNHFITLLKSKNQLYQLVTDQGFLTESRVVWETLNNIENDGLFVDGDFIPVPPKSSLTAEDQQVQVDQDYLIALSLQEEQKKEFEKEKEWETYKSENGLNELSDEEFARKLQEEESRKAGQLTNYQGDNENGQSSQNEPNQHNQSHNNEQSRDNFRSPGSGNKRSHSLPPRKNSNKPDDKSNTKCSMM